GRPDGGQAAAGPTYSMNRHSLVGITSHECRNIRQREIFCLRFGQPGSKKRNMSCHFVPFRTRPWTSTGMHRTLQPEA
ncbi:hypothetical protein, partial [Rhodovulum sulfidophilum]|uniref:hypothetical protein n=1 Tax=Rhodovulum sulfidophilum TaxID=35806 RepID=UPI001F20C1E4